MELSLKEFRNQITENLTYILWKQWAALGIATHIPEEKKRIIDLEPLLIATFILKEEDKRLFSYSLEWLLKNHKWVNLSRLKRLEKILISLEKKENTNYISELIKDIKNGKVPGKIKNSLNLLDNRGIISDIKIRKPALLQLMLRGLFGINARVEITIYLLSGKWGSSLGIAEEIFYDQKIVYRILENWRKTGIVEKIRGKDYYMARIREWERLLNIGWLPAYLNWGRFFEVSLKIHQHLSIKPWMVNQYLLSSLFRDVYDKIKPIAESLDEKLPSPELYKGEEFFEPFAEKLLSICRKIKNE